MVGGPVARRVSAGSGQRNTFCWAGVRSKRAADDLITSVHLGASGLARGEELGAAESVGGTIAAGESDVGCCWGAAVAVLIIRGMGRRGQ